MQTSKESENKNGLLGAIKLTFTKTSFTQDIYMVQICSLIFPNSQYSDFDGDHVIDARCKNWFREAVNVCSRKLLQSHDSNIWKTIMRMFETETALLNYKKLIFINPKHLTTVNCRDLLTGVVKDYVQLAPKVVPLREEVFYIHSVCFSFLIIVASSIIIWICKTFYKSLKPLPKINKTAIKNLKKVAFRAGRFNLERSMCETKIFQTQSLRSTEIILESAQVLTTKVSRKKFVQTMAMSLRPSDGGGDERSRLRGKLHEFLSGSTKCCMILSFELEDSLDADDEELVPKLQLSPPKYLHQVYARPHFMSYGIGDGHTAPPVKKMCLLKTSKCSAEYDSASLMSDCSSMASTNSKRSGNYRMRNSVTPTSICSRDAQSPRQVGNSLPPGLTNRSGKSCSQAKKYKPNLFVTKKYKDA